MEKKIKGYFIVAAYTRVYFRGAPRIPITFCPLYITEESLQMVHVQFHAG